MNRFREKVVSLGLNYRRELTVIIVVNVLVLIVSIAVPLVLGNYLLMLIGVPVLVAFNVIYLMRYNGGNAKREKALQDELVYLLSYFKIYLTNGYNVYQAIREIVPYAGVELQEMLNELLTDIDADKSVDPFIKFARNFHLLAIEQLMISIYQMIDEGNRTNYLRQFELIFDKLQDEMHASLIDKKQSALQSASIFPLIGSALLIIVVTMGVIGVIGDMVNGF